MPDKYFSSAQKQNNIAFSFSTAQAASQQIVTLVDCNKFRLFNRYNLRNAVGWINAQIVELYCTSSIISIPEVAPPILNREDGEYANLQKTQDYLWKTSRIDLELFSRVQNRPWVYIGSVPLKHNSGFRYRRHRLIDLLTDNVQCEFGEGGALGARLVNVGWGNISASDRVSIIGSYIEEAVLVQDQLPSVINTANFSGTSGGTAPAPAPTEVTNEFTTPGIRQSTKILDPREKRTSLVITVQTAGASGGVVGAWVNNNWSSTISPNPISWTSSQAGLVINGLTNWKGEVRANQAGFGDIVDSISLRVVEKYTL